ncbi:MAG: hypothetical protein CL886_06310 [Dehalococcoidia bacterium]|nr:hypothetical protein [Dehalococcoidia bacterium]
MKLDTNLEQEISSRFNNYIKALIVMFIIIVSGISIFIGQYSIISGIVCFTVIGNIGAILIYCRMQDLKRQHIYKCVLSHHEDTKRT